MSDGVEGRLHPGLQQGPILHERLHQTAVFLRPRADPSLSVHVQGKGRIAQPGNLAGLFLHERIPPSPGMGDQHQGHGSRQCLLAGKIAFQQGIVVGVFNQSGFDGHESSRYRLNDDGLWWNRYFHP